MARNADLAAKEVYDDLVSAGFDIDETEFVAIWKVVLKALYKHDENNAEVVVTSVTGVEPGTGDSGSGTGTIK